MTRTLRINGFAGEIKWPPLVAVEQVSWIEKRRINNYGGRRGGCLVEELVQSFVRGVERFFEGNSEGDRGERLWFRSLLILGICIQLRSCKIANCNWFAKLFSRVKRGTYCVLFIALELLLFCQLFYCEERN